MTAIVNTSDTAAPGVARWSASIALPHFDVAKCPQAGPHVDSMLIGRSMPRLKQLSARLPWACARRPVSVKLIGMPGLPPLPSSSED
jgi:hypothetical protein